MKEISEPDPRPSSQSCDPAKERKPFIPSTLDDYPFTPAQFRIVCRIARRGDCYESIQNMASGCKLSIKTVKTVLRFLTNHGIIEKQQRQGETSILKLTPYSRWPQPSPNETPSVKWPDTRPKRDPDHPTQKTPHKGNPFEGNPIKGERSAPTRKREPWQLLRDEKALKERLEAERESVKPDKALIESLRGQLREARNEIRNLSPGRNYFPKKGKPLSGQISYEMAVNNGASQKQLDNLTDSWDKSKNGSDIGNPGAG